MKNEGAQALAAVGHKRPFQSSSRSSTSNVPRSTKQKYMDTGEPTTRAWGKEGTHIGEVRKGCIWPKQKGEVYPTTCKDSLEAAAFPARRKTQIKPREPSLGNSEQMSRRGNEDSKPRSQRGGIPSRTRAPRGAATAPCHASAHRQSPPAPQLPSCWWGRPIPIPDFLT